MNVAAVVQNNNWPALASISLLFTKKGRKDGLIAGRRYKLQPLCTPVVTKCVSVSSRVTNWMIAPHLKLQLNGGTVFYSDIFVRLLFHSLYRTGLITWWKRFGSNLPPSLTARQWISSLLRVPEHAYALRDSVMVCVMHHT